jgi:diguanylate cyclase (GGDEF)-like protein
MRHPFMEEDIGISIAGSSNYARFVGERSGSFVADSVRDGVRRHYAFARVDNLPLFLNVALSAEGIESEWRAKALVLGGIVLALCALTVILSLFFGRELKRRAAVEAELARLSMTDPLTGLPNRRRFDDALARAWKSSDRSGSPLSVLMVDADHFKRFNDRYGHAVGDLVLQSLARALSASVHRPDDLVCRFGGEEFAIILPSTDLAGAVRVAENIHAQASAIAMPQAGTGPGCVTVSVGISCTASEGSVGADDLLRLADEAVYCAKARGRNRTECAATAAPARHTGELRLVTR